MLVLSRKPSEAIYVGNDVTVTVLHVRGGTVKLGIQAPGETRILRGELSSFNDEAPTPRKRRRAAPEELTV